MELKGCAAIVTGGSGGLGQRICHALARNGVNVVVNYAASEAKAKGVADELAQHGVRALAIKADVTDVAAEIVGCNKRSALHRMLSATHPIRRNALRLLRPTSF